MTRIRHGLSNSREWQSWRGMVRRCNDPKATGYHNYGGRGIKVCDRWLGLNGFINFYSDMGIRPKGFTLNRKDNDLGYNPDNCEWTNKQSQDSNKRTNTYLTYKGITKTVTQWAKYLNIKPTALFNRLKKSNNLDYVLKSGYYYNKTKNRETP